MSVLPDSLKHQSNANVYVLFCRTIDHPAKSQLALIDFLLSIKYHLACKPLSHGSKEIVSYSSPGFAFEFSNLSAKTRSTSTNLEPTNWLMRWDTFALSLAL